MGDQDPEDGQEDHHEHRGGQGGGCPAAPLRLTRETAGQMISPATVTVRLMHEATSCTWEWTPGWAGAGIPGGYPFPRSRVKMPGQIMASPASTASRGYHTAPNPPARVGRQANAVRQPRIPDAMKLTTCTAPPGPRPSALTGWLNWS